MPYFSGQGRVYVGARDQNGQPLGLSYVGNVPELKVSLSVETLEHQESSSGQRLTDLVQVLGQASIDGKLAAADGGHQLVDRRDHGQAQAVNDALGGGRAVLLFQLGEDGLPEGRLAEAVTG